MWYVIITLCLIASIAYPSAKMGLCALFFCLSAILPEILNIRGGAYFVSCSAISILMLITINCINPFHSYTIKLQILLLFDVILNMIGLSFWYNHTSIHVSNYIFDLFSFSLADNFGELFLYEWLAMTFYVVALFFICSKSGRHNGDSIINVIASSIARSWHQSDA